jgi:nitrate reductase NapE component
MWKTRQSPLHVTNKTSLTPPLYSEVPMPSQESELSCICVLKVTIFPLFTVFLVGFVPTV